MGPEVNVWNCHHVRRSVGKSIRFILWFSLAEEAKIRFVQADGSVSTNIVSFSPDVADTHLIITYTFEWEFPSVEKDTPEHSDLTNDMSLVGVPR